MAEALKAALRLLPTSKSSSAGASVACSRASLVGHRAFADQSIFVSLATQQQVQARERQQKTVSGLARFAKAVLTYVGVGLSVVTANQLTGPSTLLAKEVKRERRIMAEENSGSSWCCVPSNRCLVHQGLDKETASLYRHYDMLPARRGISISQDYNKKETEEDLFLLNEQWGVGDKHDLPWQFGPSTNVDYSSQYITLEETSMSEFPDFSTIGKKKIDCGESADIELEWQWLIDQQPPKCKSSPFAETRDNESKEDDASANFQKDENLTVAKCENDTLTVNSGSGGSEIEQARAIVSSNSSRKSGNLSKEMSTAKSQLKDSTSWRTADSKELAALVSQKTLTHLENCDLPPSQSYVMRKGPLASCDFTPAKNNKFDMCWSVDKLLLASLLRGYEPTQLENRSLPSSPLCMGMSDPTPLSQHLPHVSQPLSVPSVLPQPVSSHRSRCSSLDDRITSWNGSSGGSTSLTGRGPDTLGEALCHSQTRAREAEKVAARALQEKEQLVRLLFREARTSRTYKHWVQILEIENMWLKMQARDESGLWMADDILNPSIAFERLSNNRWRHLGKRFSRKNHRFASLWRSKDCDRGRISEGNILVRCTIGLAFALGLSFAGAGVMIGWSMGWILLAY